MSPRMYSQLQLGTDLPATSAVEPSPGSPTLELSPPWPNPTGSSEGLRFSLRLAVSQRVKLELHDVTGRRVAAWSAGVFPAGTGMIHWTPRVAAAGLYWLRVATEGGSVVRARIVFAPQTAPSDDGPAIHFFRWSSSISRWKRWRKRCTTGASSTPTMVRNATPLNRA